MDLRGSRGVCVIEISYLGREWVGKHRGFQGIHDSREENIINETVQPEELVEMDFASTSRGTNWTYSPKGSFFKI